MQKFYVLLLMIANIGALKAQEFVAFDAALTQGGVVRGQLPPGYTLMLNGKQIAVSPEGYFVFGFGRDAAPQQRLEWCRQPGECQEREITLTQRQYDEQFVEGVPPETVTPPKDVVARIRQESALVKQARNASIARLDFMQRFIQPLDGPVTGVYGSRRVFNGVPKRPHYGVDYAAPVGAPVMAPADGEVTLVHENMYYSGGTLIIDHGYGLSSTFIHLSEVLVKEGEHVKQGDMVAKVGKGGRATGPHLDWRLNWHQVRLDPELILKLSESQSVEGLSAQQTLTTHP